MKSANSENVKRGKLARASGRRFEAKVREDLERMGWIIDRWTNTVEQEKNGGIWKIAPAKPKFVFNPKIKRMIPLGIGLGFPDFICFKKKGSGDFEVVGVEVKANGYLDRKERDMCWFLNNEIFSKILIAKKGKKRGEIEYIDFKEKYKKDFALQ